MAATTDPNSMNDSSQGKESVDTSNTSQTPNLPDKEDVDVIDKTLLDKKSEYEKAIEIGEQLPKDDPEYQNDLASAYNDLAYYYQEQKQFTKAITAVNNAIAITKQLSENDAMYLPDWINHNHSLAEIYFDTNEIAKAKEILKAIQPMAKKCLYEKPDDSWTQELNDDIADLLSKIGN